VLWLKRYREVVDATKEWRQNTELRPAYVALRVSAFQRSLDDGGVIPADYDAAISEMLACLAEGFRLDGYLPDVVHEAFRAFERLSWMLGQRTLTAVTVRKCAQFMDEHLPAMCGTSNEYSLADQFVADLVRAFGSAGPTEKNPLRSDRWSDLIILGETEDSALADVGYETARITALFSAKRFLFARAIDGTRDFFVRAASTELSTSDFSKLRMGQLLSVLPDDDPPDQGRAGHAKHAMLA
jgi:hypothetical protein